MKVLLFFSVSSFFFSIINSHKIIKNIDFPSCKNCIYYKPCPYSDFTSIYVSKCNKFGVKNIISDEITYEYASSCRDDESKCGKEGIYFQKEENLSRKKVRHIIQRNTPTIFFSVSMLFYLLYLVNISKIK
jgi:hypothetical protein